MTIPPLKLPFRKKNAKENKTYIPTACSQCMLMKTLVSNDQRAFWWVAFFSTSFIEYVCAFIILICARALVVFFWHFAETSQWKRFNDYVCISNVYTDVNGFFLFLLWWYVSFWVSALSLLEKSLPKKKMKSIQQKHCALISHSEFIRCAPLLVRVEYKPEKSI